MVTDLNFLLFSLSLHYEIFLIPFSSKQIFVWPTKPLFFSNTSVKL